MIELKHDRLVFSFPEVHPDAKFTIEFERTLRIPDDGRTYPLPPGLGAFPLRHVDDFQGNVPREWLEHGGVMLPMYQSEAMWLNFHSKYLPDHEAPYPFAVKIAAGKIDAVTGESWTNGLHGLPQDYLVTPEQPWLDGFCVGKGVIRQFVAMPLGAGYTAEEQLTGKGEHGGLQIIVYPMKREVFEKRFPKVMHRVLASDTCRIAADMSSAPMGLAPGGKMHQDIYEDPYGFKDWDRGTHSRCFVHLANSLLWRAIADEMPPTKPITAREYTASGFPWFDYYGDGLEALEGSEELKKLKSVIKLGYERGENPVPENETAHPRNVVKLRKDRSQNRVREGTF
jgi:hypothetical protein